jgi:hypothetical protein
LSLAGGVVAIRFHYRRGVWARGVRSREAG